MKRVEFLARVLSRVGKGFCARLWYYGSKYRRYPIAVNEHHHPWSKSEYSRGLARALALARERLTIAAGIFTNGYTRELSRLWVRSTGSCASPSSHRPWNPSYRFPPDSGSRHHGSTAPAGISGRGDSCPWGSPEWRLGHHLASVHRRPNTLFKLEARTRAPLRFDLCNFLSWTID